MQIKNNFILDISRVEADIIKTMGAFEYLNEFVHTEEAKSELLARFLPLVVSKNNLIKKIDEQDKLMEATTKTFESLANSIVEDLKKAASAIEKQVSSQESAPESCLGCPQCDGPCTCEKGNDVVVKAPNLAIGSGVQESPSSEVPGPEGTR
jgi:benzoyl-CoA reductase/2-hydroxyglutaryl-CoA dehydratase subunit BcrC/BadD/HgdB